MIPELDKEWTKFLNNFPETSLPIRVQNAYFDKEVHRWACKMAIKYGFKIDEIKQRYGKG